MLLVEVVQVRHIVVLRLEVEDVDGVAWLDAELGKPMQMKIFWLRIAR